jgi:predicted nucleic acid-binding protein
MKPRIIFLDSSFIYALLNHRDQFHRQAVAVVNRLTPSDQFVITDAVIFECCSLLAALGARNSMVGFLDDIIADDRYLIVHIDAERFYRAYEMFKSYRDKEWSLVDCASFLVMRDENIEMALTADHHFEQMGFKALLRNPDAL